MITFLVISYIIITIITGIVAFLYCMSNNDSFGCALVCSIIGALIIPPIGLILLVIYLLPIIIPCATAIYIWG